MRPITLCLALVAMAACGRIGFDAGAGDASVDADPEQDPDLDGVAGDGDNCPLIANPDQDNEDGDPFGDACDPCPPTADPVAVVDPDGDNVSSACDPNPGTPGDRIELFFGFNRPPTGHTVDGLWGFGNGTAQNQSSLNELSGLGWPITGNRETVSTRVRIDQMYGNLVARPVGVAHEMNLPGDDALVCVFGINPSNSMIYAIADNATTAALDSAPATAMVGSTSTFASTRTGTSYACTANGSVQLTTTAPLVSTPNRVGLFTRSAEATFEWVLIVTSP